MSTSKKEAQPIEPLTHLVPPDISNVIMDLIAAMEDRGYQIPERFADDFAPRVAMLFSLAMEQLENEFTIKGFGAGLRVAKGQVMGNVIFQSLAGQATGSNGSMVPGLSRAAVSKAICQARRNLKMELERPNNARSGAKRKNVVMEAPHKS